MVTAPLSGEIPGLTCEFSDDRGGAWTDKRNPALFHLGAGDALAGLLGDASLRWALS